MDPLVQEGVALTREGGHEGDPLVQEGVAVVRESGQPETMALGNGGQRRKWLINVVTTGLGIARVTLVSRKELG